MKKTEETNNRKISGKPIRKSQKIANRNHRNKDTFKNIIFPIMLPVSLTTLVIRIIFKLKLADIIIIVTAGGPGGATDSVTSFIVREYRDRSNVGYGTLLSFVYLILIIIFMTILIRFVNRWLQRAA